MESLRGRNSRPPRADILKVDIITPEILGYCLNVVADSVRGKLRDLLTDDDWNLHDQLCLTALQQHFNLGAGRRLRPKRTRHAILARVAGQTGEFIGMALLRECTKKRDAINFLGPKSDVDIPVHGGVFLSFTNGYAFDMRWQEYSVIGEKIYPGSEYDLLLHQERQDDHPDDLFMIDVTTSREHFFHKSDVDGNFEKACRKVKPAFDMQKIVLGLFANDPDGLIGRKDPNIHKIHVPVEVDFKVIFCETCRRMEDAIDMFEQRS